MSRHLEEISIVNPSHYKSTGGLEAIEVIEGYGLDKNFNLGNVIKYLLRYGKKGNSYHDLLKASWYLNREVKKQKDLGYGQGWQMDSKGDIKTRCTS